LSGTHGDSYQGIASQLAGKLGFERVLGRARLHSLRKNSLLQLLLGGAAVYRCDNWFIFIDGFSR
jgi:hypothetical protein